MSSQDDESQKVAVSNPSNAGAGKKLFSLNIYEMLTRLFLIKYLLPHHVEAFKHCKSKSCIMY